MEKDDEREYRYRPLSAPGGATDWDTGRSRGTRRKGTAGPVPDKTTDINSHAGGGDNVLVRGKYVNSSIQMPPTFEYRPPCY